MDGAGTFTSVATALPLFQNRRRTPLLATLWLLTFAVFTLLVELGVSDAMGEEPDLLAMARAGGIARVWSVYFHSSQRVENTFVR